MKLITFISTGVFIVVAGLLLKKQNAPEPSLYDTKWMLNKVHTDTGMRDVSQLSYAFLQFNKDKKSAGGRGGCNSFGSTAVVSGKALSFTNIFSTKMFCEGVQNIEDSFLRNLGKATRYEIKDKTLSLYQEDALLLELTAEKK